MKNLPLILGFIFVSCAHHKDVRPGADGEHRIVTVATESHEALRSAMSQANHYCEQTKRSAAVLSEKVSYTGEMDENTRKTVKKASQAAVILGGMTSKPGQVNPVGGAGTVGSVMTSGKDYRAEMIFTCK